MSNIFDKVSKAMVMENMHEQAKTSLEDSYRKKKEMEESAPKNAIERLEYIRKMLGVEVK